MVAKTYPKTKLVISLFSLVLFVSTTAHSKIIYVDSDVTGVKDGSSWDNAYKYLQDALATAHRGDEIRVAQGIYKPDQGNRITPRDRTATFQLINGVTIKGGYAGYGEPNPNVCDIDLYETILSGDLNGDDGSNFANNTENSYHVVISSGTDATAVLDGFKITAGYANGSGNYCYGSGVYNDLGGPSLTNCTFNRNWADGYGGGMYNYDGRPTLINCTFSDNAAGEKGGGVYSHDTYEITLINCRFSGNSAGEDGGGMACWYNYNNSPILTNCIFSGNSAGNKGGGMSFVESEPVLSNCSFSGNSAENKGGGLYMNFWYGYPVLTNCILWGNSDFTGRGESAQINTDSYGPPVMNYICVQGWTGNLGGIGNIGADPCFVEPGYWDANDVWIEGDYHLLEGSPCIDVGDPNYVAEPNETDLDGRPRVIAGRIDMGAYEFQREPRIIYVDDDGPADFNNIQAAIDNSNHSDIIIVNPGTYTGDGNRDIDFHGKAITLNSTDPNDPNVVDLTIIDCNHLGRGFLFHSGEDGNSILSGFTIMNGQAAIGGGICCENQSGPTIANCVIRWNTAGGEEFDGFGGGISGCNGTISNCTISGNTAEGIDYGAGGGLYGCNGKIFNCTISNNSVGPSGYGGGLSECNGDIINCTISNNWVAEDYEGRIGRGGGLYRCNGEIINSTISGNVIIAEEEAFGGGLYECNGSIINCTIGGNGAECFYGFSAGGGLYHCDGTIINCTIRGNITATDGLEAKGGGLYACDGTISNCTISDNRAEGGWEYDEGSWGLGGGLYGCNGTIINCTISDNTATVTSELDWSGGAGGGLYGCSATITNCTIIGNTASDAGWYEQHAFGGGLCGCDGTISNCMISGNIALSRYDSAGGGLCGCDGTISNCTISGNTATVTGEPAESEAAGGGLYWCNGSITNCIIWANSASTGSQVYSSSEPTYCCVQDYTVGGTGNIGDDPLFIDPNNVDYHLFSDSPCIDAGDPNYIAGPNEMDLDGNPRVIGCRIDMGAYEFGQLVSAEARIVPSTINLASKGKWLSCSITLPEEYNIADIDSDSILLECEINPESIHVYEQEQVAIARFDREDVQTILEVGDINLTITGRLTNGTAFEAKDSIRVINKNSLKSAN